MAKCIEHKVTEEYALYLGDSCEVIAGVPDDSLHLSVFSPPFADLYSYSSSTRDMGNSKSYADFFEQFGIIIQHLFRAIAPGRICACIVWIYRR